MYSASDSNIESSSNSCISSRNGSSRSEYKETVARRDAAALRTIELYNELTSSKLTPTLQIYRLVMSAAKQLNNIVLCKRLITQMRSDASLSSGVTPPSSSTIAGTSAPLAGPTRSSCENDLGNNSYGNNRITPATVVVDPMCWRRAADICSATGERALEKQLRAELWRRHMR